MKKKRCNKWVRLSFYCSLIVAALTISANNMMYLRMQVPQAQGTSLQELTLGQLIRLSHYIFKGKVISKEVKKSKDGTYWSHYVLRCDEVWKGKVNQQDILELSLQGGIIGDNLSKEGQIVYGQVDLSIDQEGVFFLEQTNNGRLVFTGMYQGWFELKLENGDTFAVRNQEESHLHRKVNKQYFAGALETLNRLPLQKLKKLVLKGRDKIPALRKSPMIHQVYHLETGGGSK